jgi:hypothetical protein
MDELFVVGRVVQGNSTGFHICEAERGLVRTGRRKRPTIKPGKRCSLADGYVDVDLQTSWLDGIPKYVYELVFSWPVKK